MPLVTANCAFCGGTFESEGWRKQTYCSHKCFSLRSSKEKKCRRCHVVKPTDAFPKQKRICGECLSAHKRKDYYERHSLFLQRNVEGRIVQKSNNWAQFLTRNSRGVARTYKQAYDLTKEWAESQMQRQGGRCFYTGCKLVLGAPARHPLQPSFDRIDSAGGYTQDNVVIAALWVNFAKNSSSVDTFFEALNAVDFDVAPYWKLKCAS